jgi:hypothetical protein
MNEPIVQTESQLLALVDQVETIRLEFKRSALLADKREDYLKVLSKEISAFANTEGGQIVIGLEEEKIGKNKKAKKVDDGLDMSDFAMESFQQSVQSSVSPYLAGLTFHRIRLSEPGRMALVIAVPQGTTAYQANDQRYYGRTDYGVEPLRDHEVRLRMLRTRVAVGVVQLEPGQQMRIGDTRHYKFFSGIYNTGELTIRRFAVVFRFTCRTDLIHEHSSSAILQGKDARYDALDDDSEKHLILPGDAIVFPSEWLVILPASVPWRDLSLSCAWRLLLDDAPMNSGNIEFASAEFRDHRSAV